MDKVVYAIYEGSVFEDGGIGDTVYRGKGVAKRIAEKRVEELQKEQEQVYKGETMLLDRPYKWTEKSEYHWTNGIEVVKILELKVK